MSGRGKGLEGKGNKVHTSVGGKGRKNAKRAWTKLDKVSLSWDSASLREKGGENARWRTG